MKYQNVESGFIKLTPRYNTHNVVLTFLESVCEKRTHNSYIIPYNYSECVLTILEKKFGIIVEC